MANRPGGNNPTGRSSNLSPRRSGASLAQFDVQLRNLTTFLRAKTDEARRAGAALEKAHLELAISLQEHQQGVLLSAIQERGRPQYRGDKLVEAVVSKANRSVSADGFTVGRLDEIPAVRQYWRGLEFGSSAHIGQFLPGYFVDEGGNPLPFQQGGRDRFAVRSGTRRGKPIVTDPRRTGAKGGTSPFRARIRNEIPAIHFQKKGLDEWRAIDGSNASIVATYARYLKRAGIEFGLGPGNVATSSKGFKTAPAPVNPAKLANSTAAASAGAARAARTAR